MKRLLQLLWLCGICLACRPAIAQQHAAGGKLTRQSGEPVIGATIVVKGTQRGTVSGSDGSFSIEASPGDSLIISSVGLETREVTVTGPSMHITLSASRSQLNDVVVVGYGTEKKVTLTGAVSAVSMKTLKEAPVTNFSNTLAGKLPGVFAINGSGEPGEDNSSILIRGNHSLNNNQPLVVIDGVPSRGDGLSRLNPNDIEQISVLKDATASIYGSEAANGVILVTTKHGGLNQEPVFSLNVNQGFNQPTRIPRMADAVQYMSMLDEVAVYTGLPQPFSKDDIAAYQDPKRDPWLYPNTDWFKAGLKPWSSQTNANLSVQGGTNRLTYFISMGGETEDGYYKRSATRYNQYNFRSNISDQVTKSLKLNFDLSGRKEDRNFPTVSAGQTFFYLMKGRPTDPAYYPNGLPGPDLAYGYNPVVTGTTQTGTDHNQQYYLSGDLSAEVTIPGFTGFDLQGHLSYNKEFETIKNWQKPWTLYSFDKSAYINNGKKDPEEFLVATPKGPTDPELTETFLQQETILENLVANYKRDFGPHHIGLMAGTELRRFQTSTFDAFRRHFISTALPELFAGSKEDWTNDGSAARGARLSYFSRANYTYKDKYLFEFVGRYDGSYLFPEHKRYGFFPAFSAGWRMSEEPFFKSDLGFFDELKLRASWGKTGNDITNPNSLVEDEQYLSGFQFGSGYVFGVDQVVPSIVQSRVANPEATWERSRQTDVGIDGSVLDSRLSFTVDYWNEVRSGILIQPNASVPLTTGYTIPKENIGRVKSWGYDGSVAWTQQVSDDFSFDVSVNGGYATNKILFWDETPGAPSYQRSTGKKVNASLYYQVIGVFQNQADVDKYPHWGNARPGDLIFKDVNGDGKIDADDRERINKTTTPDWTGGIHLGATWRQFSVSVFFQGAAGAVQYVSTQSGDIGNYFRDFAEKRWRPDPDDPTGMTPDPAGAPYKGPRTFDRTDAYWSPQGSNNNTYFLRNTNYVRLKTLEVGYNFPSSLLAKWGGIKDLRIYANGFNLVTWDSFKLMDPEASDESGAYYPQTRVINMGVNLSF